MGIFLDIGLSNFFLLGSKSPGHMVILDQTKGDHCRPSRRGRYEKVSPWEGCCIVFCLFPKEDNSVISNHFPCVHDRKPKKRGMSLFI